MGHVATDLWPYVVTAIISIFGTYFSLIQKLKERVAVLESKCENMEKRVDSHSGKIDDILEGINEIKITITRISSKLEEKEE